MYGNIIYQKAPVVMRHLEALTRAPEADDWRKGRPEDWANESLLVGRRAYRIPGSEATLRSGDSIGRDYERENVPRAADRLARAAVRLAVVLEDVFKDGDPETNPVRGIRQQGRPIPVGK